MKNNLILICYTILIASCTTAKKSMYFPDLRQTDIRIDSAGRDAARKIYPGDRISVQIVTLDEETNKALNTLQKSGSDQGEGLLVDPAGFIEIPTLGKFYVKGKTPTLIREEIKGKLVQLYRDATVYCTMTGRVVIMNADGRGASGGSSSGGSGVVSIPIRDERLTIPEVLSGISSANLKLKKTWIIRELDGKRQVAQINLNSSEILKSPFFYLRNNDVIYFEPRRFNLFLDVNAPTRNLFGILTGLSGLALAAVLAIK
jgi:polysaccharide biosynthesis/export protein